MSSDLILYGEALERPEEKYIGETKKDFLVKEPNLIYQILPTATKKILDGVIEVLDSGNEVMINALKANIKAFLEGVRSSKPRNCDKKEGGD